MKKIKPFSFFSIALSFIFTSTLIILAINIRPKSSAQEVVLNDCSGAKISISSTQFPSEQTSPVNSMLSGVVYVNVATAVSSPQISDIIIGVEDANGISTDIGRARYSGINVWTMPWMTNLWKQTTTSLINVYAKISYSVGGTVCKIKATSQNYIYNQVQSNLIATISPGEWNGITNSTQTFTASLEAPPVETTKEFDPIYYAIVKWSNLSNIGTIANPTASTVNNNSIIFSSGKNVGSTELQFLANYGGAKTEVRIPITVSAPEPIVVESTINSPTTPLTTPTTTNTNQTSNSTVTSTTPTTTNTNQTSNSTLTSNTPTQIVETSQAIATNQEATTASTTETQVTSSKIQIDGVAETCIEQIIGSESYAKITSGEAKTTATEISQTANCFSATNYIIPTKFLPIAPEKIDEVAVTTTANIKAPENVSKTTENGEIKVLKFSGKANPNSTVLVYIFSDPLVVTTTTDSDGNWEYTLEDPMQPGRHEVYIVVDKGNGILERSDPIAFFISTAVATEANPEGLNLALSDTQPIKSSSKITPSLILYIAGSVTIIIITLIILFFTIKSHNKHKLALITKKAEIESDRTQNTEQHLNPASTENKVETTISDEQPIYNQSSQDASPLNPTIQENDESELIQPDIDNTSQEMTFSQKPFDATSSFDEEASRVQDVNFEEITNNDESQ